jgi:hypothetical protein
MNTSNIGRRCTFPPFSFAPYFPPSRQRRRSASSSVPLSSDVPTTLSISGMAAPRRASSLMTVALMPVSSAVAFTKETESVFFALLPPPALPTRDFGCRSLASVGLWFRCHKHQISPLPASPSRLCAPPTLRGAGNALSGMCAP